ncbi:hypothetical protein GOB93_17670 [Acetobacter musti]|uniref:Uncharacterized protein n=1 Tax=Acetobacter musti TaxID=864732 RepID=A0ABX0JWQ8_9PROT|nr:hypothetical protein [Acetobacter musti]NHN86448.1 hypothetical protein [Acetobacter musti]
MTAISDDDVHISDDDVHNALAELIRIEPDTDSIETIEAYRDHIMQYREEETYAMAVLRGYARQFTGDIVALRERYYALSGDKRYRQETTGKDLGVVTAALKDAWSVVPGWQN